MVAASSYILNLIYGNKQSVAPGGALWEEVKKCARKARLDAACICNTEVKGFNNRYP
jgi:hypothetical protein